jgi:nucleotide-binding universal stress UspA family protein
MYQVLVPVDDDANRAMQQARYVAGLAHGGGDVATTILAVLPPAEVDAASFDDRTAAVSAADHLGAVGVDIDRRLEGGHAAERILEASDEIGVDEIVMGGRKRSGVARVLLGSTVQDVFRSTERPVTVASRDMIIAEEPGHVLLPVDKNRERALDQARYVVDRPSPPPVTVLHVFRHQDYAGAPPHEFAEVESAVAAADRLEDAGVDVDRVAIGGEIARTITEHVDDKAADAIVVGGRKRSGVQKVLLGSVAQDLLLSAERPVTLTG